MPRCGALLKTLGVSAMQCSQCTFKINKSKFEQMVNDMYVPKRLRSSRVSEEIENQDRLSKINEPEEQAQDE